MIQTQTVTVKAIVNDAGEEFVRVMPFYCGKRFAGICVVLGYKKSSTYFREYASGFLEPAALHLPAARCASQRRITRTDS
jgi:hypothetical protein